MNTGFARCGWLSAPLDGRPSRNILCNIGLPDAPTGSLAPAQTGRIRYLTRRVPRTSPTSIAGASSASAQALSWPMIPAASGRRASGRVRWLRGSGPRQSVREQLRDGRHSGRRWAWCSSRYSRSEETQSVTRSAAWLRLVGGRTYRPRRSADFSELGQRQFFCGLVHARNLRRALPELLPANDVSRLRSAKDS